MADFHPCSGQSGRGVLSSPRKHDWGVARYSDPTWRYRTADGRLRTFPTWEQADAAARRLEALHVHA